MVTVGSVDLKTIDGVVLNGNYSILTLNGIFGMIKL